MENEAQKEQRRKAERRDSNDRRRKETFAGNVLPRGMDAQKTEDFIIKACDYYRKYLIHQRDRDSR